jgi:hypothetical protein
LRSVRSQAKDSQKAKVEQAEFDEKLSEWRAGCLYRQTAGSWNVLDTLSDVIICNHLSATRRFRYVPEPSMGFYEVPWDSMRFREIP